MTKIFQMQNLFAAIEDLRAPDLATRELGLQAYPVLCNVLSEITTGGVLALDFTAVRVMDSSFAGGSVIRLLRELVEDKHGDKYIILTHTTDSTEYNLNMTIRGHGLKLGLQVIDPSGQYRLIGQIEPNLDDTLALVNKRQTLTARDLADLQPGMAINTASNRLKKLFDLRLIQRMEETTETGRQHVYHAVTL